MTLCAWRSAFRVGGFLGVLCSCCRLLRPLAQGAASPRVGLRKLISDAGELIVVGGPTTATR